MGGRGAYSILAWLAKVVRNRVEYSSLNNGYNARIRDSEYVKGKPVFLKKEEFDSLSKGKTIIYSGSPQSDLANVFNDISESPGQHAHGFGLYFTDREQTARGDYAGQNGIVATAYISSRAKLIDEAKAHDLYKKEMGHGAGKRRGNESLSVFLRKRGYDGMVIPNVGRHPPEKWYLIFNRNKLRILAR